MNIETFIYYTNTYGSRMERWPGNVRNEAEQLLQGSLQARDALKEAARLDLALSARKDITVSADLQARIMAVPSMNNTMQVWNFRPYHPALAIAACMLLGIGIGLSDMVPAHSGDRAAAMIWGSDESEESAI